MDAASNRFEQNGGGGQSLKPLEEFLIQVYVTPDGVLSKTMEIG